MAKKSKDINELLRNTRELLDSLGDKKKEVKKSVAQARGCKNHPNKLIYRKEFCKDCYSEYANLLNKKNAEKEPWLSTDGYMKIYREDGTIAQYHRWVVEQTLNRRLQRSEQVKFVDNDRTNCKLENLRLVCDDGIDLSTLICVNCGELAVHELPSISEETLSL